MRASVSAELIKAQTSCKAHRPLLFLCLALYIMLLFSLSSCSTPSPVVEIVTTDASRSSALPPGVEAIAKEPKLPARDADIETAGDRIAEAITHLNAKRREAALRALNQSETALNRALKAHASDDGLSVSLRASLKDLDIAERAIQRGSADAAKQLATINRNLDGLDLQRAQQAREDAGKVQ